MIANSARQFLRRMPLLNGFGPTVLRATCIAALVTSFSALSAFAQGYSPGVACSKMTLAEGFAVDLVAAEPHVRQPVCIEFDDRGRLWVVQYLQYPNPAGLKRVKVDRYSRTVYDRVPEPPPHGPKGADRITILEDTDGDGRVDKSKDFVSGLNLTTGLAFGYDGVFVLNVPYLLFYPDRNHDDVPDSDPEVLLAGFGMEDTSSLANSLTWGPDGWLYGTQGTNITAHIRGIDFEQGVWRYHPRTREFELFCEGGGNSWGLDFDETGNLFYSTNMGGNLMHHGMQGAYYAKSFQKHGELHNPFAFGYFEHVPHKNFHGGHVTVGGIVYQENLFPSFFRGKFIAADLLGHGVNWHTITRDGSTVRTAHGGSLLQANDAWFAPSDVTTGPDGAVYVADWFDKRTAHPDPDADWDKSNGRIYRIHPRQTTTPKPASSRSEEGRVKILANDAPSEVVVERLFAPDGWHARRALRMLYERRNTGVVPQLLAKLHGTDDPTTALRTLWGIYASGGFDERLAAELLNHPVETVRAWTVRFLGDERNVSARIEDQLRRLAATETSPVVLAQLAASAKRLPALCGLRIAIGVAENPISQQDRMIPLLVWWAVEHHATADREFAIQTFTSPQAWRAPLVREVILGRLIKRYAAEGTPEGFTAAAAIFASAPSLPEQRRLLAELDEGLKMIGARSAKELPLGASYASYAVVANSVHREHRSPAVAAPQLQPILQAIWEDRTTDPLILRVACRMGSEAAYDRLLQLVAADNQTRAMRIELLRILDELGKSGCAPTVLTVLRSAHDDALRTAALSTLGAFDLPQIDDAVLQQYRQMSPAVRTAARNLLLGRPRSAGKLLSAIDRGQISAADVQVEELRRLALYNAPALDAAVRKRWGNIRAGTPEEKLADIRRLSNDLRAAAGRPDHGHELFKKHCATCHQLFGEGIKIGPDLTTANRKDRDFLLVSIVDPSVQVRKEFLNYALETRDGRVYTGLVVDQSPSSVTLVGATNQRTTIPRSQIEDLKELPVSLMPERILDPLKPQEVRDLFSYLQK